MSRTIVRRAQPLQRTTQKRKNAPTHVRGNEMARNLVFASIVQLVHTEKATLLKSGETAYSLVLRSGEMFSLGNDGVTRLN